MNRVGLLIGFAFGFLIAAARVNDYDVIHRMLLLQEFDVFLLMGSAVLVAAVLLWILGRLGWQTPFGGRLQVSRSRVERKHVYGALVFGTGWAIAGTCPGPALAMTASGSLLGLLVMAGLFTGLTLHDKIAAARAADARATSWGIPARS